MVGVIKTYLPGVWIVMLIGFAAMFLSNQYGAPVMLFALLLGLAVTFLYKNNTCKIGIDFASSKVLRIGVALLGVRIVIDDLLALGWQVTLLLLLSVVSTIVFGLVVAKAFGLQKRFGVLTGGAVGICGASAALAISAVLPPYEHQQRDTSLAIIGVTTLSTITMIFYPIIVSTWGLETQQIGIFLGATIHDVAQVVGAGYSLSEPIGDLATLTKLVRVAMLVPVVFAVLLVARAHQPATGGETAKVPFFLMAFIGLMILNSVVAIPVSVVNVMNEFSRFALIVAIVAVGMKSDLSKLFNVGIMPVVLMVLETGWIALVVLLGLWYLG